MNSPNIEEDGDEKTTSTQKRTETVKRLHELREGFKGVDDSILEVGHPKPAYKNKCLVCNSWMRKGRCEPCYGRKVKAEKEAMIKEYGRLPPKARIGKI